MGAKRKQAPWKAHLRKISSHLEILNVNNRYVLDKEFSKAKKEYCKFYKKQCEKSPKHKQEEKGQDNESDLANFIIGLDQIVKDTHSQVLGKLSSIEQTKDEINSSDK